MRLGRVTTLAAAVLLAARAATAQTALSGDTIHITRATGPITVDGDLSDAAWRDATRVEKWYETKPGDNLEPKVRNVGYLTFDDKYLLRGIRVRRPESVRHPRAVRRSRQHQRQLQRLRRPPASTRATPGSNAVLFRRDAPEHAVRRHHRRFDQRRLVARLLLGLGDEDHRSRLDAGDAHPVLVHPLQERGSADLARHAVPELPARLSLSILYGMPFRATATASCAARTC